MGEVKLRKPERFYGDPVEKFTAMANAASEVDRMHFKMWCRIAAEEIAYARSTPSPEIERLREALQAFVDGADAGFVSVEVDRQAREALRGVGGKG